MADESRQPETEERRRPMADPRMEQQPQQTDTVSVAAMYSGWAALVGFVVLLFWMAVSGKFGLGPQIILGVSVLLTVFWLKYHWSAVRTAARGRSARLGANSVVFVLFVLGILVMVNVIAARRLVNLRHDFTENQLFSLSDQTREVVRGLDKEVGMIAFLAPAGTQRYDRALDDRLREYEMLSPKLTLQTHDYQLDLDRVREYNVTSPNTVIVTSGDRKETVVGGGEEQLTSTILAVTSGEKMKVYFLTGHGENGLEAGQPRTMATLKANLENQQFECKTLTLATEQEPKVPDDCAILVIAGPTEPIRDKEMQAIQAYAEQGGKLFVALEPTGPDLSALLEAHGVRPLAGTVIDPGNHYFGAAQMPMVASYGRHATTEPLQGMIMALPTTRAFEVLDAQPEEPMYPGAEPPPSQQATPILETSADAWLETATSGMVSKDPGELGGPLVMAAVVDKGQQPNPYGMPEPEMDTEGLRMVVVGDADMMTDDVLNLGLQANIYFVLNAINWLVENEKLISIPPKDEMPRYMTMSNTQVKLVWALTAVVVPLLVLLAGGVVWWRRR